jgi:MYXO-CTERM domain-containing protein
MQFLFISILGFVAAASMAAPTRAAAKPPTPSFAKAIDGFASYDAQDTCDPTAKPGTVAFKSLILKTYSVTGDYGITRACNIGGTSEHKEGRAWDWKVNYYNATQKDIAQTVINWLLAKDEHGNACALARRTGMMYFIWNKQIWGSYRSPNASCSTAGWKGYTGSNPHTDHVHFSWGWPGAKKQTTFWTAPLPTNKKPTGYLDGANCSRVWGWAQDADAPKKSIDVHLYFGGPAGNAAAKGVPITADIKRDDLCSAIGSCNHGYEVASPLSLHDGKPHPVHAYGIDSGGGANGELSKSPGSLQCTPKVPEGVKRHVVDGTSFKAWGFSYFWDVMPLSDSALGAIDAGPAFPKDPLIVRVTGGTETWLIDADVRRLVSADALSTWDLDASAVVDWAQKDLDSFPVGPPLRDRPLLVQGSGAEVYLVDDDTTLTSGGGGGGAGGIGAGGAWGSGASIGAETGGNSSGHQSRTLGGGEEGCACRAAGGAPPTSPSWLWLSSLAALVRLRRRR